MLNGCKWHGFTTSLSSSCLKENSSNLEVMNLNGTFIKEIEKFTSCWFLTLFASFSWLNISINLRPSHVWQFPPPNTQTSVSDTWLFRVVFDRNTTGQRLLQGSMHSMELQHSHRSRPWRCYKARRQTCSNCRAALFILSSLASHWAVTEYNLITDLIISD